MKGNKVNIKDFAYYAVRYFEVEKGEPITNLTLQKILYYVQAYHLVYFDKNPLFNVEPEAWVRGPVYGNIYSEFKDYGSSKIKLGSDDIKIAKEDYQKSLEKLNLTSEQINYISFALNFFGDMPPNELIFRSHSERPWVEARAGLGPLDICEKSIKHDVMYSYYKELVDEKQKIREKQQQASLN